MKKFKVFKIIALCLTMLLLLNSIVFAIPNNDIEIKQIYGAKESVELHIHDDNCNHNQNTRYTLDIILDAEHTKFQEILEKYSGDGCEEVEIGHIVHGKNCECDDYTWQRTEAEELNYQSTLQFNSSINETAHSTMSSSAYPYCCSPYHWTCGPYLQRTNNVVTRPYHSYSPPNPCGEDYYRVWKCSHCNRTEQRYEFTALYGWCGGCLK